MGRNTGSSSPKTGLSGVSLKSPPATIRSMPTAASESARNRRPAVLGRVVVHQHSEGAVIPGLTTSVIPGLTGNLLEGGDRCPIGVGHDGRRRGGHDGSTGSLKHAQQDVPGGHDGVRSIEVAGFGVEEFQAGGAIEDGDVDAATVGGVVVDILVVKLAERGFLEHLPQDKGILHLFQTDDIRQPSRIRLHPEQRFRKGVRLRLEPLPGPVPLPCRRKLHVRHRRGIIPPVEKVLHVPEHHLERIRARGNEKPQ